MGMRGSGTAAPGWLRRVRYALLTAMALTLVAGDLPAIRAADGPAPLPVARTADGREAAPERIVVGFRSGVTAAEQEAVHRTVAAGGVAPNPTPVKRVSSDAQVIDVTGAASLEAAIAAYTADPRVRYAEPDYVMRTADAPNDASFAQQYGMAKINAPAAWDVTRGAATVKIAILDCGIAEGQPDLVGKVVARVDFTGSAYGADDRCNHGTHVAGIAAARTNNGVGVAGAGYATSLLNVKVLSDGGAGYDTQIAAGIRWAADNGANVINMSLGGAGACSQTFQDAIDYAWSKNVVVVAAAGNNGGAGPMQPADCARVVSVASTDASDAKSSFSNFGSWVTVAAPGSSIYSTLNPAVNSGALYGTKSGTSMATPHVAGLAALVWATRFGTSAAAVVARITGSADAIAGTGSYWQYGRINAAAAVGGGAPVTTGLSVTSVVAGTPTLALTVTGENFTSGASLLWNGTARAATVVAGTTLIAVLAGADLLTPGTVSVAVRNPDGMVSTPPLTLRITAPPLRVTAVSPASGDTGGGATVTLRGDSFQPGVTVTFGGIAADIGAVSVTSVTVTAPAHAAGAVDIVVTNPDGQIQTLAGAYTYTMSPPAQRSGAAAPDAAPAPRPQARPAPATAPNAGSGSVSPAPAPAPTAR